MKKYTIIAVCLFLTLSCASRKAVPYDIEKRYFIAVTEFSIKTPQGDKTNRETELARQKIMDRLLESGRIRLIEREKIDRIIAEQQFAVTGLVDADSAAKVGKLAGVDAVLIGEITPQKIRGRDREKNDEIEVTVSGRLIHTTTGEILASAVFVFRSRIEDVPRNEKAPRDDIKRAIDEAVDGFIKEFIPRIPEKMKS